MFVHVCTYVCMYVCLHVYMYTYTYTHIYMYVTTGRRTIRNVDPGKKKTYVH